MEVTNMANIMKNVAKSMAEYVEFMDRVRRYGIMKLFWKLPLGSGICPASQWQFLFRILP